MEENMQGQEMKVCFPCWKRETGIPEEIFDSEIARIKMFIGQDGDLRKVSEQWLRSKTTEIDSAILKQHVDVLKKVKEKFMVIDGVEMAPQASNWLKNYIMLITKIADSKKQKKRKMAVDVSIVKEATPEKIKATNYIMNPYQEVPHYWWPWSHPRIFRLKLEGDEQERTVRYITNLMVDWNLGVSFKVNPNPRFTWITLNSEEDRELLKAKFIENGMPAEIPKWINPGIKLKYMKLPVGESWLTYVERIMKINGFTDKDQYDIGNMSVFPMPKDTFGISLRVSGYIRSMMEKNLKGRLATGDTFLRIYDEFRVICCRNCLKLGHPKCQVQPRCCFCGKDHPSTERCDKMYCATCDRQGHAAKSRQCILYMNAIQRAMAEIDYTYKYIFM